MADTAGELAGERLADRLAAMAFRPDDRASTLAIARQALESTAMVAEIDRLADLARSWLGRFPAWPAEDYWAGYDPTADRFGEGVLPLLALVLTAPEVAEWHRLRGIPPAVSTRTLGELGQQVWVHRQSAAAYGLHTYPWLATTWSGSLYWLGRLQFNLQRVGEEWVCSTHIPRSGPFDPAAVDESFRQAARVLPATLPGPSGGRLLVLELAARPAPGRGAVGGVEHRPVPAPVAAGRAPTSMPTRARCSSPSAGAVRSTSNRCRSRPHCSGWSVDRLRAGRHWGSWSGRIPMRDWAP